MKAFVTINFLILMKLDLEKPAVLPNIIQDAFSEHK